MVVFYPLLKFPATRLLYSREDTKIIGWCRTQASSYSWQGIVDNRVDETGVSTTAPGRSVVSAVDMTRAKVAVRSVVAPRSTKTDPCGMPFLRRRKLFRLFATSSKVMLRLPTSSMIMRTLCLSGSNCSNLQVTPRCHTVS